MDISEYDDSTEQSEEDSFIVDEESDDGESDTEESDGSTDESDYANESDDAIESDNANESQDQPSKSFAGTMGSQSNELEQSANKIKKTKKKKPLVLDSDSEEENVNTTNVSHSYTKHDISNKQKSVMSNYDQFNESSDSSFTDANESRVAQSNQLEESVIQINTKTKNSIILDSDSDEENVNITSSKQKSMSNYDRITESDEDEDKSNRKSKNSVFISNDSNGLIVDESCSVSSRSVSRMSGAIARDKSSVILDSFVELESDSKIAKSLKLRESINAGLKNAEKSGMQVDDSFEGDDSLHTILEDDNLPLKLVSHSLSTVLDPVEEPRSPPPMNRVHQIRDTLGYRISANFNIQNALSSTIIGDSTPSKKFNHFDGIIKSEIMTPRSKMNSPSPCSSPDIVISDSEDDDYAIPVKPMKQPTLHQILQKVQANSRNESNNSNASNNSNVSDDGKLEVSHSFYLDQKKRVQNLQSDVHRTKNLLNTLNLSALPDKGQQLLKKHEDMQLALKAEEQKLENMTVKEGTNLSSKPLGDSLTKRHDTPQSSIINISSSSTKSGAGDSNTFQSKATGPKPATWEQLNDVAGAVQPRTFGKQAMATHNAQKALTMDRLQHLHGSLKSCPTEDTFETDPKGLKVELMPHQKHALAWLLWREKQKPSGGILADDMGLGKTLTMISLILRDIELYEDKSDEENEDVENKYNGGTLIVCPASLMTQWDGEIRRRLRKGLLSSMMHHGPNRENKAKKLCKYDIVLTTYSIVMNECGKDTAMFKVKWQRIILDEAHQVRNYKAKTSIAVCTLLAKSRWALTGTPIHNKEVDIYALLKFLRVTPFDDLAVFKRWVSDKNSGGQERMNTVMSSLMLRRTKAQLQEKGSLNCLPERHWEIIEIRLEKREMDVYQKVLIFSRTLFSQFLHQRAEKNQDYTTEYTAGGASNEYMKMHKKLARINGVKDVKQHEILVLLLRLRQICCHPSLIQAMLQSGDIEADQNDYNDDPDESALNLLEQLNKLTLDDNEEEEVVATGLANQEVGLAEATRGILKASNSIFDVNRRSSKLVAVIEMVKSKVLASGDKCIIVSQWTSLLKLLAVHLKEEYIKYEQLDGTVAVNKRAIMIDSFNDPNSEAKVLLLSLTAGGVGLNLVGANHLFLLDLHWNPQLEMQAQDRIYRVGQKKPVYVYKFMALDTIEERIKKLQDNKREMAEALLVGARMQQSKLSLDDLKMLFSV